MVVTAPTFLQLIHEDQERPWELHHGVLREKPPMAMRHNAVIYWLDRRLHSQLNPDQYHIRLNAARTKRSAETYFIPDLAIIPADLFWQMYIENPARLEIYTEPLPLVVEVWSPSTGDYDVDTKLPEYQARGDAEIWRIHPDEQTVTSHVRHADSTYRTRVYYLGDTIRLAAIPDVIVTVADLFYVPSTSEH